MSKFLVALLTVDVPVLHNIFRELRNRVVIGPFGAVEPSVWNDLCCLFAAVDGVLDLLGVGLFETLLGFFWVAICSYFEPGLSGAKGAWFNKIRHGGWESAEVS